MEPKVNIITLGVKDFEASVRFYESGLGFPRMPFEGRVAFFTLKGTWLALFPRDELAADAGLSDAGTGFSGITLAHNVGSVEAVDAALSEAVSAGATLVKPSCETTWGGYSGYFSDLDGHLWEVAYNPFFRAGADAENL